MLAAELFSLALVPVWLLHSFIIGSINPYNVHTSSSRNMARFSKLEELWKAHMSYEFNTDEKNVSKLMQTMASVPSVNHVPTLIGGDTSTEVEWFYRNHFVFSNPSMDITIVSRTIGYDSIVDEMVIELNHTSVIDWLVPSIPPTGRNIRFPLVAIVSFTDDSNKETRIKGERLYWDQATVLHQLGVLDCAACTGSISGREQADKILEPSRYPLNLRLTERTAMHPQLRIAENGMTP